MSASALRKLILLTPSSLAFSTTSAVALLIPFVIIQDLALSIASPFRLRFRVWLAARLLAISRSLCASAWVMGGQRTSTFEDSAAVTILPSGLVGTIKRTRVAPFILRSEVSR